MPEREVRARLLDDLEDIYLLCKKCTFRGRKQSETMKRPHSSNNQSGEGLRQFEEFYRLHFAALSRYVTRRLPISSHDDVMAAAFVIAWKKFASVETPSLPWLYRIASFEIAHERRRLGRIPESVELSDLHVSDKYDLEDVMDISLAFAKLSEND